MLLFYRIIFRVMGSMLLLTHIQCSQKPEPIPSKLALPDYFESTVFVDSLAGKARHIAVRDNGDVFVKLKFQMGANNAIVVRDEDGDGIADIQKGFGQYKKEGRWSLETGIQFYKDYVYFSSMLTVYRQKLDPEKMLPVGPIEVVVQDDHEHGLHEHIAKPISFDDQGHIYVPFGAPSNACQEPKRTPRAPGLEPCPQLDHHAGVWRFDAEKLNQTQEDGVHMASGIRSIVAMDWNPLDQELYVVIHGRDDLLRLFSNHYNAWESAMLPSEEFVRVKEGDHYGWPYCYYDQIQGKKVLAPEYGGDGDSVGRCSEYKEPLIGFPGHWAPNGLLFYTGDQFPERYKGGAFIAFHGSTIRAPYPQSGYFVAFVPFKDGQPTGEWEVFADGFAEVDPIVSVNDAAYRPMGLAEGPDGSLYIGDTEKGRIWKVVYTGPDSLDFGPPQLAAMEEHKSYAHIRTPDIEADNLQPDTLTGGEKVYQLYCANCHQKDGKGASGRFPPLAGTEWVTGDKERLISIILNGREEPMEVLGETYTVAMPQHSFLSDIEISQVLTYIRQHFGNTASPIGEKEVQEVREKNPS